MSTCEQVEKLQEGDSYKPTVTRSITKKWLLAFEEHCRSLQMYFIYGSRIYPKELPPIEWEDEAHL